MTPAHFQLCYPPPILLTLSTPADNTRGPQYVEQVLAGVGRAAGTRSALTLAFGSVAGRGVGLFVRDGAALRKPLEDAYPGLSIDKLPDDALEPGEKAGLVRWEAELRLRPEVFPLLRYSQFEDQLNRELVDPVRRMLRAVDPGEDGVPAALEIHLRPASRRRAGAALRAVRRLDQPLFRSHPRLARFFAAYRTSRDAPIRRPLALLLGLAAGRPHPDRPLPTETTGTRQT